MFRCVIVARLSPDHYPICDLTKRVRILMGHYLERGGVKTLVFGHSHVADRARFGRVDYFNTGTWIRSIDPFRLIPLPTQTYLLVDDQGTPRLLQWTDHGPLEPILIRRD